MKYYISILYYISYYISGANGLNYTTHQHRTLSHDFLMTFLFSVCSCLTSACCDVVCLIPWWS